MVYVVSETTVDYLNMKRRLEIQTIQKPEVGSFLKGVAGRAFKPKRPHSVEKIVYGSDRGSMGSH